MVELDPTFLFGGNLGACALGFLFPFPIICRFAPKGSSVLAFPSTGQTRCLFLRLPRLPVPRWGMNWKLPQWLEPSLDTIFGPPVEEVEGTQNAFKTATELPQKGSSRTVVHDGDRVQNDVT